MGQTSLPRTELLLYEESGETGKEGDIFRTLRTRWTLQGIEGGTKVDLNIEAQWNNPVYATMCESAAPKVAGLVVEAFERRAKEVLG